MKLTTPTSRAGILIGWDDLFRHGIDEAGLLLREKSPQRRYLPLGRRPCRASQTRRDADDELPPVKWWKSTHRVAPPRWIAERNSAVTSARQTAPETGAD